MTDDAPSYQARSTGLIIKKVDEELVIYDEAADLAHHLNPTAALVWRQCEAGASVGEIASEIASEAGLPADEEVVRLALEQLTEAGLLQSSVAPGSVSRRSLIHRLGLAAGAVLMLPVVNSIAAPSAAQAGSPPPTNPAKTTPTTP